MAQCNRCNAPLANGTTRSLNMHRIYCSKSKPMKYRQRTARMSGTTAAQLSKSRRRLSKDKKLNTSGSNDATMVIDAVSANLFNNIAENTNDVIINSTAIASGSNSSS